jgi:hypothetical protein
VLLVLVAVEVANERLKTLVLLVLLVVLAVVALVGLGHIQQAHLVQPILVRAEVAEVQEREEEVEVQVSLSFVIQIRFLR